MGTFTEHDELRYIAELILAEKLGALPFIEKHHPSIAERVRFLSHMQIEIRRASKFLHENPPTTAGLGVASYLSWAGLVFIEIGRYGRAGALSHISTDKVQFLSQGFNSPLLSQLAFMQGVTV